MEVEIKKHSLREEEQIRKRRLDEKPSVKSGGLQSLIEEVNHERPEGEILARGFTRSDRNAGMRARDTVSDGIC